MNNKDIIDYIKQNYPKLVFQPIQFEKDLSKALGFIITENKLVIGFVNKNGTFCKLIKPIDLNDIISNNSNEKFLSIITNLPVLKGFTEKDRTRVLKLFTMEKIPTISEQEHKEIVGELQSKISELELQLKTKQNEYDIFFDSQSNKTILIEKEYQNRLAEIKNQYERTLVDLDQCKNQIVNQNEAIINGIAKYKDEIKAYIREKEMKEEDLQKLYDKSREEIKELQSKLKSILENEQKYLNNLEKNQDIISESESQRDVIISEKQAEINLLKENIRLVTDELERLKENLSKSEMNEVLLQGFKDRCREKILKEKQQIIQAIQDYNNRWLEWSENVNNNVNEYKLKILSELRTVQTNLKQSLDQNDLSEKETIKLKQSISDIENELKKVISNQLAELSAKEEQIKRLEQERQQCWDANLRLESELKTHSEEQIELKRSLSEQEQLNSRLESEISELNQVLNEQNKILNKSELDLNDREATIDELKEELEHLRSMLDQNAMTKIETTIDYENCYQIVKNFIALNNIFYRKLEIIEHLKTIINEKIGIFQHLNQSLKEKIAKTFTKVRDEIMTHINFLNLSEYINSPNIEYLKNKTTREYVPDNFCKELSNLLDYWNLNKEQYREQDRILTNIYEDLSGAVRVYVRIKPLLGPEQKMNTVIIEQNEEKAISKKQKLLTINCQETRTTFGEFYGIFNDTFTNLDVYTGQNDSTKFNESKTRVNLESLVENLDSISPGLYSVFRQVEDGYSIVLFGYGSSGSGKTMTLLGSKGIPGLLHYGLDNLKNVQNIKLKYLFEQYYNLVNINFNKLNGKIYNLINKIPQLSEFAKDETELFKKEVPSFINTNNLKIEDLYSLTDIIDNYRKQMNRIKTTPNNPVSSRSHLFLVFEITFKNGKTGYITIVDMAGKESPLDLYNTFIDTSKTKLASIMAPYPVGGEQKVAVTMKPELMDTKNYSPRNVFEILQESFYINETINHLIYYFNLKSYHKFPVQPQSKNSEQYDTSKFYVNPQKEQTVINTANNCLMIPILKFLDNLSKKNKLEEDWLPTKFVTICNIRQEEKYCNQIFETLQFAQKIKST